MSVTLKSSYGSQMLEELRGSCNPMDPRLLCPWASPGKNTGVGCHFLLQGIFPTQGLNPGLLHCKQVLYRLTYKKSPT